MVYFKAPKSYTGEDMIEFQLHGGRFLCEGVLQEILNSGARLAENGEFSKLAFLNGKMSLDKAEGIIDLIEAESEQEIKAGYELVKGKLFQTVTQIQDQLLEKIAEIILIGKSALCRNRLYGKVGAGEHLLGFFHSLRRNIVLSRHTDRAFKTP